MPTYEYKCTNGHHFEVTQRMVDDPLEVCPECGARVERVFHPVAVHFKGSGFYTTDYGAKKKSASDGGESKGESKDSKDSKTSDSKKSDSSSKTATSSE
jgi:putative FmdB family regulatory protein